MRMRGRRQRNMERALRAPGVGFKRMRWHRRQQMGMGMRNKCAEWNRCPLARREGRWPPSQLEPSFNNDVPSHFAQPTTLHWCQCSGAGPLLHSDRCCVSPPPHRTGAPQGSALTTTEWLATHRKHNPCTQQESTKNSHPTDQKAK